MANRNQILGAIDQVVAERVTQPDRLAWLTIIEHPPTQARLRYVLTHPAETPDQELIYVLAGILTFVEIMGEQGG